MPRNTSNLFSDFFPLSLLVILLTSLRFGFDGGKDLQLFKKLTVTQALIFESDGK